MKINKLLKIVGIIISVGSVLFGLIMITTNLMWIIQSHDFSLLFQYVYIVGKYITISLILYGFGECLELLYKINTKLQGD